MNTTNKPYTIMTMARAVSVSDSTIRQWSAEFAAYLGEEANPDKGEVRQFDDADYKIFQTIAALRRQYVPFDEIHVRLAAGKRVEFAPPDPAPAPTSQETAVTDNTITAFNSALQSYERQLDRLTGQIDRLQTELRDVTADKAAAVTRADMLQAQIDELKTAVNETAVLREALEKERSKGFWERLRRKG